MFRLLNECGVIMSCTKEERRKKIVSKETYASASCRQTLEGNWNALAYKEQGQLIAYSLLPLKMPSLSFIQFLM